MKKAPPNREFEVLFREYFRPLTVFAMQYVKVQEVAEDIVQDLFLYLYEKEDFAEHDNMVVHYLYRLVRYRCLNHLEFQNIRKKKNPEIQPDHPDNQNDPLETVKRIELEHKYLQSMESLTPKCRKVFEMSRLEGKRNQEIADELKLSKRTVETHISQALKILRKKLGDYLRVILF
jgi:RNA polymerase sigma-70 factor (ECF subfamily)